MNDEDAEQRAWAWLDGSIGRLIFGVTDTEVQCKPVRHAVMQHALLSFAFATIVLTLAVNVITNLLSGG